MHEQAPRQVRNLAAIGLGLHALGFCSELAIGVLARRSLDAYVVVAIVGGLPLLVLHLTGLILGILAKRRARKTAASAAGSSLAIGAGLFGLVVTTLLVLGAGLSGAAVH